MTDRETGRLARGQGPGGSAVRGHKSGAAVWGPEFRVKVLGSRFWDQGLAPG